MSLERDIGSLDERQTLISPAKLAARWDTTTEKLSSWRKAKRGPVYVKIGGTVLYVVEDVERFEQPELRVEDVEGVAV